MVMVYYNKTGKVAVELQFELNQIKKLFNNS